MLARSGMGLGMLGLTGVLSGEGSLAPAAAGEQNQPLARTRWQSSSRISPPKPNASCTCS